jgi:hypothetical protein
MLGVVVAAALAVPRQGLVTGAAGGYTGHGCLWGSAFTR